MPTTLNDHVLLRSLNAAAKRVIETESKIVRFTNDEVLFKPGELLDCIWFVRSGLVSMVTQMQDGSEVDGLTVGRDGALGLPASLGSHKVISRAVVQVAGEALCAPGHTIRQAMSVDADFSHLVMRYYETIFAAVVQISACNAAHTLEQRFCRFLLSCRDQIGTDTLPLQQDFISRMLGISRASVIPISRALQMEQIILVRRGRIQILSLDRLRSRSCECYGVIAARFSSLC